MQLLAFSLTIAIIYFHIVKTNVLELHRKLILLASSPCRRWSHRKRLCLWWVDEKKCDNLRRGGEEGAGLVCKSWNVLEWIQRSPTTPSINLPAPVLTCWRWSLSQLTQYVNSKVHQRTHFWYSCNFRLTVRWVQSGKALNHETLLHQRPVPEAWEELERNTISDNCTCT
jgi:hypothetical protein